MNGRPDDLTLRKELLIARSALHRARLRHEVVAMRARASTRLPLFSLFMLLAGRARAAGWIGKAAAVLAIVRTVHGAIRLLKK